MGPYLFKVLLNLSPPRDLTGLTPILLKNIKLIDELATEKVLTAYLSGEKVFKLGV